MQPLNSSILLTKIEIYSDRADKFQKTNSHILCSGGVCSVNLLHTLLTNLFTCSSIITVALL
jgi:hypothetical protein